MTVQILQPQRTQQRFYPLSQYKQASSLFSCAMLYKLALMKNSLYWFFTPQDSKKIPACPLEILIFLDIDDIS